ncbi:MAG TPA: hypothetical protein VHT91_46325 [Kofleriaceae bacterium]|jgi:hypothetical protein|nr:hypothetical protein [Kofleriaceae bacterium]
MTTIDFQILDPGTLSIATGGKGKPSTPDTSNDFASRYVNNVKQDALSVWNRAGATANDLKAHNWGGAAKNFGAEVLDEVGTVGDAIAPVKALF